MKSLRQYLEERGFNKTEEVFSVEQILESLDNPDPEITKAIADWRREYWIGTGCSDDLHFVDKKGTCRCFLFINGKESTIEQRKELLMMTRRL